MARNLMEEQLMAIRNKKSMLRWKCKVSDDELMKKHIENQIEELSKEETKLLKEMGVY